MHLFLDYMVTMHLFSDCMVTMHLFSDCMDDDYHAFIIRLHGYHSSSYNMQDFLAWIDNFAWYVETFKIVVYVLQEF